jgi:hypothetical protein
MPMSKGAQPQSLRAALNRMLAFGCPNNAGWT